MFTQALIYGRLLVEFERDRENRQQISTDFEPKQKERAVSAHVLNRKIHRWGAILTALPLLVVIGTGIVLQLKKNSTWIQPATQSGSLKQPDARLQFILDAAKLGKNTDIKSWKDISRLDVRPSKGIVKVRANNSWELQLDLGTLAILQESYRRSDLIESIHDGSYFGLKLIVFLPTAIILLVLWVTGLYLFFLPYLNRRKRARKKQA